MKSIFKKILRKILPLSLRKYICIFMESKKWFDPESRSWMTKELLRDLEDRDRDAYHRFLWSHHLAYAQTYEVEKRFGVKNMVGIRKVFFSELWTMLGILDLAPEFIRSTFEVGCSLGYQLHYLETNLFPNLERLEGIDLDAYAIDRGNSYLKKEGSKVRLFCGDMADMEKLLGGQIYDLIYCTGVLMYLQQKEATRVVGTILKHCRLAAFSGLAHPLLDNSQLEKSSIRENDGSFIHNIDAMIKECEGNVVTRRWDGNRTIGAQTVYFVFATGNNPTDHFNWVEEKK